MALTLTRRRDDNIEFLDTAAGRQALIERDAERTMARRGLIGELRAMVRRAEMDFPALVAAEQAAVAKVQRAEAALRSAKQQVDAAMGARQAHSNAFSSRRDAIEAELRQSASPLIADFLAQLDRMWSECRSTSALIEQESATNIAGISRRVIRTNNWSIKARLEAIRWVQENVRRLMLEEPDQSTASIGSRLQIMREAIPEISNVLKAKGDP